VDADVVVFYGPNGLGKTSFFDAIDYVCTGRIGRLCRRVSVRMSSWIWLAVWVHRPAKVMSMQVSQGLGSAQ